MSKTCMHFVLVFVTTILAKLDEPSQKLVHISKRKANECNLTLFIKDSHEANDSGISDWLYEKPLYRRNAYTFSLVMQTDCVYKEISYKWSIVPASGGELKLTDNTNNVFILQPFTLEIGDYALIIDVFGDGNKLLGNRNYIYCEIYVIVEKPLAIIKGGTERIVESDRSFRVDGSDSVDRNVPVDQPGNLKYKWKCEITQGSDKNLKICPDDHKGSYIEVPAKHAITGYTYIFTMSVSADSMNWTTTEQTVIIQKNDVELEIICEKNCPSASPITNAKDLTFLKAKCVSNCKNVNEKSFKWTVENTTSFNYEKSTQFGQYSDKFIIKANVLLPGNKYRIRLSLNNGQVGSSVKIIEPHIPPKIDSCTVTPAQGKALETEFRVDCKYSGSASSFEIYSSKNNKNVQIARSAKMADLKFRLPVNTNVFIKVVDDEGSSDDYQLTVNVQRAFSSNDQITRQINRIGTLIKTNNIEEAVQIANAIIEEIDKNSDFGKAIRKDILRVLKEYPIISHEDAIQVASIVARIVDDSEAESDPYQGEAATEICKDASTANLNHFQKESLKIAQAPQVSEVTKTLTSCGDTDSKENFGILKGDPLLVEITTPFPLLPVPAITEDYPDYPDDSVLDKTQKYDEISQNVVNICTKNLKMMALTVAEGEQTMNSSTEFTSVEVTSDIGQKLVGREIEAKGASIQVSGDFKSVTETVNVMVCSWSKDPFWWNSLGRVVNTDVILLKIAENDEEIVKFKQPNIVIFKLYEPIQKVIRAHEIEKLDEITVIRVDVRREESFYVQFYNLTSSDSFRVSVDNFEKPGADQIRKSGQIVNKNKTVLYQKHDRKYDSWHYISIIPEKLKGDKFWISVYSKLCYSWNASEKKWEFACKSILDSAAIKCHCNHLSILAGIVQNNRIKVDRVLYNPDFEMVLIHSYVIFISLCIVFGIFFIALLFISVRASEKRNIYFPADSESGSLYLYLVRIRTGKKRLSATSSTICIKIFGEKYTSRSHVLNYPDSQKRIFHWGSEDWFLIPIRHHLGAVKQIALWSDYSGRSPSWFCSSVKVYDFQTKQEAFFKLNTWLCLPPNGQVHLVVDPSEEKPQQRDIFTILSTIWPRRSHQLGLTALTRLTLLLSIILTIFLSALLLYGLPKLELKDGFAWVNNYGLHLHVILIALTSSFVSCLVHGILILLFQKNHNGKIFYYCWLFLIFNILVSETILLIFGFWLPLITAWLWLTSVAMAILIYFFLFENIFEKIYNIFYKSEDDAELSSSQIRDITIAVEAQRRYLFHKFGEDLLRPYLTHFYQPLEEDEIERKKLSEKSRLKLVALMEDIVMVICYTTLLFLAIFANRNNLAIKEHQEMLDILEGLHTRTNGTIMIRSLDGFYDYVNTTLLLSLQRKQWYWKYIVDEPGTIVDFNKKYLGVARLRQQRVVTRPCKGLKGFTRNQTCRKEFWTSKKSLSNFNSTHNVSRLVQVWSYTRAKIAGRSVVVGKFGAYTGGGFIAPLGRTLYNSYVNLNYLRQNHWLDVASSVVFVEFLTYNVNSNLFCSVRILIERSATSYFRVRTSVEASQLLFNKDEDTIAEIVIFASFTLIVFIFTIKTISRIWRGKVFYVGDLWIFLDLLIVTLSYVCFGLFIHRAKLVKTFLESLTSAKRNEFLNYFNMFHEDFIFDLVAALLIFISTVRLWKLCRFATNFRIVEKTIAMSFFTLLMILVCHVVVFIAFACWGYMMFGAVSDDFKDFPDTLVTLFVQSAGLNSRFDPKKLLSTHPVMWGLYYGLYMIVCLLLFTVYIAVVMIYYCEAQKIYSDETDFADFKEFTYGELLHYKTFASVTTRRLVGGASSRKTADYVTPKPNEIRYAACMTINRSKIETMRCVAIYTLKKDSLSFYKKVKLMTRICTSLWDKDHKEAFYGLRNERNKIEMIHDGKIQKMAKVVQIILSANSKKKTRLKQRYEKAVRKQMNKLDIAEKMLSSMLRIMSNIEIK